MSSMIDDEQLRQFQIQSDNAFLEMQTKADQDMRTFLEAYAEQPILVSFRTPDFTWGQYSDIDVPVAEPSEAASQAGFKPSKPRGQTLGQMKASAFAAKAMDEAHQAIVNQARDTAGQATFDVAEMGQSIKRQAAAHAEDMKQGARTVLQQATGDLGEMAKRQASAMREAAQRVMREETSLRGMAQRAKSEFNAAKDRLAAELIETGQEVLGGFQDVVVGEIKDVGNEFGAAIDDIGGGAGAKYGLKAKPKGGAEPRAAKEMMSNPAFRKQDYSKLLEHDDVPHAY